jgi:hypothetical protein
MLEEVVEEVLKRRQPTAASAMYGAFSSVRISVREEEIVEQPVVSRNFVEGTY